MEYEPQINCTNAYDINLEKSISRLVRNGQIDLLSTPTLTLSQNGWKIRRCTLYGHKNQTSSYDFSQINGIHALDSSVSFKPIFVDFTLVIYANLVAVFIAIIVCVFLLFCTRYKQSETFQSVYKTIWLFHCF